MASIGLLMVTTTQAVADEPRDVSPPSQQASSTAKQLEELEAQGRALKQVAPGRARVVARRGLDLARTLGERAAQARLLRLIGATYHLQSKLDEALPFFYQALSVCEGDICRAVSNLEIARTQLRSGHSLAGMIALRRALELCEGIEDRECVDTVDWGKVLLAHLAFESHRFDESLEAARSVIRARRATGLPVSRAMMLAAKSLDGLSRQEESLALVRQTIRQAQLEKKHSVMASARRLEGALLCELRQCDEGLKSLEMARDLFDRLSKPRGIVSVELATARAYISLHRISLARAHLTRAKREAKKTRLTPETSANLRRVALEVSIIEGRTEVTLALFRDWDRNRRELQAERFSQAIASAQAEIETVQRERQLERLQHASALASMQLSRQRSLLMGAGLFIFIMVVMGLLLVKTLRRVRLVNRELTDQKQELSILTEELAHEVKQRESLLHEVNHRVNGNLQIIASLIRLQMERLRTGAVAQKKHQQLLRDLESRIEAVALVHRTLYSGESISSIDLVGLTDTLCEHLRVIFGFRGQLEVVTDPGHPTLELSIDHAVPAALIACELVSNALEHAFAPATPSDAFSPCVEVHLRKTRSASPNLFIEVRDNGTTSAPMPCPRQSDSFGLCLVDQLAVQLGGAVDLRRPATVGGLVASVRFPLKALARSSSRAAESPSTDRLRSTPAPVS